MNTIQLLLMLIFIGVLTGISYVFSKRRQKIKKKHILNLQAINQSILLHKTQLNYRENGLLQYNFLKYNLDESLKIQPEINLI